jgi:hypothetical protein
MMPLKLFLLIVFLITLSSCNVEDLISELGSSKITAKEKVGEVLNKAKNEFSPDAKLSGIYGREVSTDGTINLLDTQSLSMFFYAAQSDSMQQNKIYIPVYKSTPIESPIDLQTTLDLVQDENVKNYMSLILGKISTLSIDAGINFANSDAVLETMFNSSAVINFRTINPETKIDMYLVPSKSIDSTFSNSADWIVNFYTESESLVMWLHSANGNVQQLQAP